MSRVTKLQKHYRRLHNAKKDRRSRYWAKSRRVRLAQGGKLYDWMPGHRTPIRGQWNVIGCRCGHKRHGKYGCQHGCAWGSCGDNAPLMLQPIGDIMHEFEAITRERTAALLRAFVLPPDQLLHRVRTLPDGTTLLVLGDSHVGDLIAGELDKRL
jgi:hypothetical protein